MQLHITAHRLLDAVRSEPIAWQDQQIHCTASIGCARFPLMGAAIDVPLERAISLVDKALYRAKHLGRDRACVITLLHARSEQDLISINEAFETATAECRVQVIEAVSAAA